METLNLHLAQHAHTATSGSAGSGPRFARKASHQSQPVDAEAASGAPVVLRRATREDSAEIARLAALDGARRPEGAVLVAEIEGHIAVALPLDGGRAIADPFRPTAHLVELLQLRMRLLGADDAPSRPRHGLRLRLRGMRLAA